MSLRLRIFPKHLWEFSSGYLPGELPSIEPGVVSLSSQIILKISYDIAFLKSDVYSRYASRKVLFLIFFDFTLRVTNIRAPEDFWRMRFSGFRS